MTTRRTNTCFSEDQQPTRKRNRSSKKPDLSVVKKEKFQNQDIYGISDFEPSIWQKECLEVIEENKITFVDSYAGTGKTSVALYYACKEYLADTRKKIVFVRTPAEMGGDRIGFLPGDANLTDKLGPHFESTKNLIIDFIGKNKFEADLDKRIFFTIPNFALGHTREDCIYIIDESQLLQPLILKLLLERIGQYTKTIVLGSSGQLYVDDKSNRNALRDALKRFFDDEGNSKYDYIGYYKFPIDAVMRDDVVKDVIRAYDND
jgi:phosphate starvation-inducible protein PhoH